jgi:hydroxymethylglutaryl-CoA reductase
VKAGHVKVEKAREILASLPAEEAAAATGTG